MFRFHLLMLLFLLHLPLAGWGAEDASLLPDGTFEQSGSDATWPKGWGRGKLGGSWEMESGNHFLRLTSPKPGELVMIYQPVAIKTEMKALELTFRMRVSNLQKGKESWFDARVLLDFKDAAGKKLPGPAAPNAGKDTDGWVTRSVSFLVPTGAVELEVMPTLFQVAHGVLDLDDIVLRSIDPTPLLAKAQAETEKSLAAIPVVAPERAKWPLELHVSGTKVINLKKEEVQLRGVNVVSLEWSARGEHLMEAVKVALEDWHANVIRLPVTEDFWSGKGAKDAGEGYRRVVDNVVTLVANHGCYLLLDLHRFRAPKAEHVAFWKDAAKRYQNHPAVLFDLFNEPHGTTWEVWQKGGEVSDPVKPGDEANFTKAEGKTSFTSVGMQALLDAVRMTGAQNVVLVGGLDYAYDLSGMAQGFALKDSADGHGIILSTHIYAWKKGWRDKVLVMAEQAPIFVGEVGANTEKMSWLKPEWQEDAATWVPAMLGFMQQYGLHWTAFCFHPKSARHLLTGWEFKPTPEWGGPVQRALRGEKFTLDRLR